MKAGKAGMRKHIAGCVRMENYGRLAVTDRSAAEMEAHRAEYFGKDREGRLEVLTGKTRAERTASEQRYQEELEMARQIAAEREEAA